MGSAAVREAIAHLNGWTISLWLTAEPVYGHSGGHGSGKTKMQPSTSGPMRGQVELLEDTADVFLFRRYGRAPVQVKFRQVVNWHAVAPPPPPPMVVEDTAR